MNIIATTILEVSVFVIAHHLVCPSFIYYNHLIQRFIVLVGNGNEDGIEAHNNGGGGECYE